ncbi:hypothetical protein HDU92_004363 [Lobulomyces angularis]|nr:hypothetical protein HDU92_004363 [Lobulomyces angularis]
MLRSNEFCNFSTEYPSLLELGCGNGMSSIAAAINGKFNVTTTDFDNNALTLSKENAALNNQTSINYFTLNWHNVPSNFPEFDMIIGADIIYMRNSLISISNLILNKLKPNGIAILIDPGRCYVEEFLEHLKAINENRILLLFNLITKTNFKNNFKFVKSLNVLILQKLDSVVDIERSNANFKVFYSHIDKILDQIHVNFTENRVSDNCNLEYGFSV